MASKYELKEMPGKIGENLEKRGNKLDTPVRNPETGETMWFSSENARALINRREGWMMVVPKGTQTWDPENHVEAQEEIKVPATETEQTEDDTTKVEVVLNELDKLRAEATKRGIQFDARWGKRKLAEAIEIFDSEAVETEDNNA